MTSVEMTKCFFQCCYLPLRANGEAIKGHHNDKAITFIRLWLSIVNLGHFEALLALISFVQVLTAVAQSLYMGLYKDSPILI